MTHSGWTKTKYRWLTLALFLLFVGLLTSCGGRRLDFSRSSVANPDEEVYGTAVVVPPGNRVGDVPEEIVSLYKQRVPNQYKEKPLWTF